MKMRQLKEALEKKGAGVTERMVKYYIETNLMPAPDYPEPNQANYSEIHFVRLLLISRMKDAGLSASAIKQRIRELDRSITETAESKGISEREAAFLPQTARREYVAILSEFPQEVSFSREELLADIKCDRIVFDLAIDTGALENKEVYNASDRLILLCICSLFEADKQEASGEVIETISDISKINNIASQMAAFYTRRPEYKWLYEELLDGIIKSRMENRWV